MSPEATYRRATPADTAAIASVIGAVIAEGKPTGFREALSEEQVRTWMARLGTEGSLFLCLVDGEPAAFGAVDFDTQEPDQAILGVWVLPSRRREGLGTALAERALAFAREKGYKRIRGRLPEGNPAALSFLSSIGALVPLYNPDAVFELPL